MKYNTPKMEVVELEVENVIITSFGDGGEGTPDKEPEITPGDNWD